MKVSRSVAEATWYNDVLEALPIRQTFTLTERHNRISEEVKEDQFSIGIKRAKTMLIESVQRGTRSDILSISRRYLPDRQNTVKQLNGRFTADMVWAKYLSLQGNKAIQIYSYKYGFNASYPVWRTKNEQVKFILNDSVSAYRAPEHLIYDGASIQVGWHTN